MRTSPTSGPRLTLFVTVLSLFLMVALLVGTAVTITNYIEARKTAVKSAADVFHATINQINERRLAFFAPVFLITDQLHNAPSFHQAGGSKEPILPLVLSSLKSNPQISAAYAGYENGNYFQVLSISDAEKPFVARLGGPLLPGTQLRKSGSTITVYATRPGDFSTATTMRLRSSPGMLQPMTLAAAVGITRHWKDRTTPSERPLISSRPRLKWE